MTTHTQNPPLNHLLEILPSDKYERLFPLLELVPMPLGEVLYESGGELHYAYFPTDCIVSLLYVMENGASAEIAVVGNEGIIGVALFMGGGTMPNRAVVQSAGYAYRLRATMLKQEISSKRAAAPLVAALYPGADYPDGTDGGLQPASFRGPATLPLVAAKPRPANFERVDHDPGIDRQYAGRAPRRRYGGRKKIAASGID